ncbi:hypothetical protein SAMN07250955_104138 [Arboricoccus pini]|uniref:Tat pathway signal sequence domain protein n=1 Tax=Arboricoccus pini TaxID=1963835 RepID=A0A212QYI2_9PROT|nr:hypothetical protein [Arboricoccus pini]SNB64775.1 hypothetical protein SAMN07250955_104138 [Arboricoccus pini]
MFTRLLPSAALCLALAVTPALAEETPTAPPAQSGAGGKVTIELNKLEPVDQACRIYLLLRNDTDVDFTALQLELVSFGADGVINQRVAVDLAPLQPKKTLVKLFDVQSTACDSVTRLLLNDTLRCEGSQGGAAPAEIKECLAFLAPSSKGKVEFWK